MASLANLAVRELAEELRRRFGTRLVGVRLFGSWARDEATQVADGAGPLGARPGCGRVRAPSSAGGSAGPDIEREGIEDRGVTHENRLVHIRAEVMRGEDSLRAARELLRLRLFSDAVARLRCGRVRDSAQWATARRSVRDAG
jgi:hypothetical protein